MDRGEWCPVKGTRDRREGRRLTAAALIALLSVVIGCDAGIRYRPTDGRLASDHIWTREFGDLQIETAGVGGLSGAQWLSVELAVKNRGTAPAAISHAVLRTGAGEFSGGPGASGTVDIPPQQMAKVTLAFEFDRPISKVFIEPVALDLTIRSGGAERVLTVPLQKE